MNWGKEYSRLLQKVTILALHCCQTCVAFLDPFIVVWILVSGLANKAFTCRYSYSWCLFISKPICVLILCELLHAQQSVRAACYQAESALQRLNYKTFKTDMYTTGSIPYRWQMICYSCERNQLANRCMALLRNVAMKILTNQVLINGALDSCLNIGTETMAVFSPKVNALQKI